MSGDTAALLAALVALITAGANIYTFVATGKQIDTLVNTVKKQADHVHAANRQLGKVLESSQATVDKIVDRVLPAQPSEGGNS